MRSSSSSLTFSSASPASSSWSIRRMRSSSSSLTFSSASLRSSWRLSFSAWSWRTFSSDSMESWFIRWILARTSTDAMFPRGCCIKLLSPFLLLSSFDLSSELSSELSSKNERFFGLSASMVAIVVKLSSLAMPSSFFSRSSFSRRIAERSLSTRVSFSSILDFANSSDIMEFLRSANSFSSRRAFFSASATSSSKRRTLPHASLAFVSASSSSALRVAATSSLSICTIRSCNFVISARKASLSFSTS